MALKHLWPSDLDLRPTTMNFDLDLDILPLYLMVNFRSVCLSVLPTGVVAVIYIEKDRQCQNYYTCGSHPGVKGW